MHRPVLLKEATQALAAAPGKVIVDCTVGLGGHAEALLKEMRPGGRLIGIDRDADALKAAQERLNEFKDSLVLVRGNFGELKEIFEKIGVDKADGFLFDLGVSSLQLDTPGRGFSFRYEAPLDMRMDGRSETTASQLVNKAGEAELDSILWTYGEERFHRRIARAIADSRKRKPIETTGELVEIILRAVPYKGRHGKVHPATRTFQALRIAVNKELTALENGIAAAIGLLNINGVICVISYHSLEDRIVKNKFKEEKAKGILEVLYKKPLRPGEEEIEENARARSAKLRAARKIKEACEVQV